jgi:hypothetical protein
MFSLQVKTIFRVLGEAFLSLAAMPADTSNKVEMTGTQYIDKLDLPDAGQTAAVEVFAVAAPVVPPTPKDAVSIFAPTEVHFTAHTEVPTVYMMTAKAGGVTREAFHTSGWTDEQLIESERMTVSGPNVVPASAGAEVFATAPVVTPVISTPPAPPPAVSIGAPPPPPAASPVVQPPVNVVATAAPDAPTPAMRDSNNLPWDARIHASSRTQTKDGVWTKRKGVSGVEFARVSGELLSAAPAPVVVPFTPLAPQPGAPASGAPLVAPAPPPPAPAPPPPVAGNTDAPTIFPEFCKWLTAKGLTPPQAEVHIKAFGLANFGALALPANAAFIPLVHAELAKQLA